MEQEKMDVDVQPEIPCVDDENNAENLKKNGNELYKQKKYREALDMYSEAIRLLPTCAAYYGNRSATYMMLNKFTDALEDAKQATTIDKEFTKGYQREGKCLLALGNALGAMQSFDKCLVIEPNNKTFQQDRDLAVRTRKFEDEAQRHYTGGDFRRATYCMNQCLKEAPNAVNYKLFKAECLAFTAKYEEASEISNSVLAHDNTNADGLFVRGLILYYEDNIEKAQQHFKHVLRMNPDHAKAKETWKKSKVLLQKKEEGNSAFKSGDYQAAFDLYTSALEIDPHNKLTNAKIYNNRATVNTKVTQRVMTNVVLSIIWKYGYSAYVNHRAHVPVKNSFVLSRLDQAVEDCTKAIELDEKYVKAYARRAATYKTLEQFEEAVRDYEQICKLDPSRQNKQALQDAKIELKKSKRKDYYKILGVAKDANDDQIKKAYRKRAMLHHPDRHSHDTPEKQKEEERIFKDVGEAYAVLSDPKKRARFDSGVDLDDDGGMGGGGFGGMDANNIFQMFFGGGAGGGDFNFTNDSFGGGFPGGHSHHHRRQQQQQQQRGGFPGGFQFQF